MPRSVSLILRGTVAVAVAASALLGISGCRAKLDSDILGGWQTTLVGYNTTAQSVMQYEQTVTFAEDGTMTFTSTLPGVTERATGVYEITARESTPTLRIKWDAPVEQPTTLYFTIDEGKLITSPAPEGLAKPPNLNVTNADPVVYSRISAP